MGILSALCVDVYLTTSVIISNFFSFCIFVKTISYISTAHFVNVNIEI